MGLSLLLRIVARNSDTPSEGVQYARMQTGGARVDPISAHPLQSSLCRSDRSARLAAEEGRPKQGAIRGRAINDSLTKGFAGLNRG